MSASEARGEPKASGVGASRAAIPTPPPVRVALPQHLRTLARLGGEAEVAVGGAPTAESVLDALEAKYPMLRGTIRDHATKRRRAFVRYFACGADWSHEPERAPLPEPVARGAEPFVVLGALAGG